MPHRPVLVEEVLDRLAPGPGSAVVDGTLGSGGHAIEILKRIGPEGRLIGLDLDPDSIARCRERLKACGNVSIHQQTFARLPEVLDSLNIRAVNAVLLDIGLSTEQLEDRTRGFSFEHSGPLDMRMDPAQPKRARDLVNVLSKEALEKIFRHYGEEWRSAQFAEAICRARRQGPIETTGDLVRILQEAMPRGFRAQKGKRPPWARRHPATRVFQALRIAVNDELGTLERALPMIWEKLASGGRLGVISFHSLEDRIVKRQFRLWVQTGVGSFVTKKPVTAGEKERKENPRSRSAKLRVIEKR